MCACVDGRDEVGGMCACVGERDVLVQLGMWSVHVCYVHYALQV